MVQRWRDESERQFCVLPFYENDVVVQGRERYMLWGRALSNDQLYPIPLQWYSLDLVPHRNEATALYRWVCQMEIYRADPIRMELNSHAELLRPRALPGGPALSIVAGRYPIAPELVQRTRGTAEKACT